MLDISIKNAEKIIQSTDDAIKFLSQNWIVTEKYDGVKLSLIRNSKPFNEKDYTENWIVAYKGSVLYESEYKTLSRDQIKKESIGTSQFAFVFDHLKKVHHRTQIIPPNTEIFIEYLMNKPTLTRSYHKKHTLVIIGFSYNTEIEEFNGKVITKPGKMSFSTIGYKDLLQLDTPRVLTYGPLYPKSNFEKAIVDENLKLLVSNDILNSDETYYSELKNLFLNLESNYGGKNEGVVFQSPDKIYKILQEDQHDTEVRRKIKDKYQMDYEFENKYYQRLRKIGKSIIDNIPKDIKIDKAMEILGQYTYSQIFAYSQTFDIHPKKSSFQICDDLHLTAKNLWLREMKGNNGAIFIGRFQPPTKMHVQIVREGLEKFDNVYLVIVVSKKKNSQNPFSTQTIEFLWRQVFPKIKFLHVQTGNISRILEKSPYNINAILAGSDRKQDYEKQLTTNPDVYIDEIFRFHEDVSATKVRESLFTDSFDKYKKNMDPVHYKYFEQLKKEIEYEN
jgi:nicotinamide mononucleotide adenylyltransferase